jgi:hypothetical protein
MNPLPLIHCLSIMPVLGTQTSTPTPVLEITQQHILRELKRNSPQTTFNIGIATCPNVIHFEEGVSEIKLSGQTPNWNGEKIISYTDALAQRPIEFGGNFSETTNIPQFTGNLRSKTNKPEWKKWLLWSSVGVAAAGAAYYISQQRGRRANSSSSGQTLATGIEF